MVIFNYSITCADDWPAWRGPRGDGISLESNGPLHWSTTDNIRWKTPIPGTGLSSPIVAGELVFVTTGLAEDQSRHLIALDRKDGRVRWDRALLSAPPGQMHRLNTTASSTPLCDGERIITVFTDETGLYVYAVNLQGESLWSKRVGDFASRHGFAASPVAYETGVIVNGQQDGAAFVVNLDRQTGDELWRYSPEVKLRSFSTPVVTRTESGPVLVLSGSSQTVGLDPARGTVNWFATGPSEKFVSTPSVGHGMVFSFGGSPEEKSMAIRLGGSGDVSLTHVAWRKDRAMPYVPSPLLAGSFLHVVNDQGIYSCIDPVEGKTLFSARKFGNVCSSPIAVGERIYLFEDSGTCTVVKNGSEFLELAKNQLDETIQTTPAFSDSQLCVRSVNHVFCIGTHLP